MLTSPPIADEMLHKSIVRAVESVCQTMMRQDVKFIEKTLVPDNTRFVSHPHIFGCVGFVGKIDGVVYLCISDDFAMNAAVRILGMSEAEVTAEGEACINDVIGEITNMTVGVFKNALCDVGYPCKLTLPTIVRGQNLAVAAIKEASRHVFHFDCSGHRLTADIQIKAG